MKKRTNQDLLGITSASFDHRSEAFRQKMFNHFQSKGRQLWTEIAVLPERKSNGPVIFSEEGARPLVTGGPATPVPPWERLQATPC